MSKIYQLDDLPNHLYDLIAEIVNSISEHRPNPDGTLECKCGHNYLDTQRGVGKHQGDMIMPIVVDFWNKHKNQENK